MKEFEKIKRKIKNFAVEADSKKRELIQQIEKLQADLQEAKKAEETAIAENRLEDFQLHQASQSMLAKQLEKLNTELQSIEYASLTATEHNAVITELKKTMSSAILSKYQELVNLLDTGETIVQDIENITKEYYAMFTSLNKLVGEHDTDYKGVPYRKFSVADVYKPDMKIVNTFCETPQSTKVFLKNKINRRLI